jgi:hypothetical protein
MLLPPEVEEAAIDLSYRLVAERDAYFVLNPKMNRPHIPLFAATFPHGAYQPVIDRVKKIVAHSPPLRCVVMDREQRQGHIALLIHPSKRIVRLRERVVRALAPLRENWCMPVKPYTPHLAITRFIDTDYTPTPVPWAHNEFTIRSFSLYAMGEYSTCEKCVRKFPAASLHAVR